MAYRYDINAEKWLDQKGFNGEEKKELLMLLDRFEGKMKNNEAQHIILPKTTSGKVAAFFDLLYLAKDIDGSPTCFEQTTVKIPDEVKERFEEGMGIKDLEDSEKTTAKATRDRMYPKRRGSKYG